MPLMDDLHLYNETNKDDLGGAMAAFRLANIVFEGSDVLCSYPSLMCKATGHLKGAGTQSNPCELTGPARYDFTTYFNALPVRKWREYTLADGFFLHIELRGDGCTLVQTTANAFSHAPSLVESTRSQVNPSHEWLCVDLEITTVAADILAAFQIETKGHLEVRNAYYYTKPSSAAAQPVELAVAMTTFEKEAFVTRNIRLFRELLADPDDPLSSHLTVHIVDNGRTLDADELSSEHICIHPNPNVGGSGGFARGMIESLEQKPQATHILLMDDDVLVSPESIRRTYILLALAKPKYREAFISGAMLNLEEPDVFSEDIGYMTAAGAFSPLKQAGLHISQLHSCVSIEEEPAQITTLPSEADQRYAGWWFCVIPTAQIKHNGLPLPLFVRADDAEYALRCKPRIMTMNGICVWHAAFKFKYNAAVERYQVTRNTLIARYATGFAPKSDFLAEIERNVRIELDKCNYADAELVVKGIEDFLNGPEFIMQPGVGKRRFIEANREREHLRSASELADQLTKLGVDLDDLTPEHIAQDQPLPASQRLVQRVRRRLGLGKDKQVKTKRSAANVSIIDATGWAYPVGKLFNAGTIVAIDPSTRRIAIRHIDANQAARIQRRFNDAMNELHNRRKELQSAYESAAKRMTSVDFWKGYLQQ